LNVCVPIIKCQVNGNIGLTKYTKPLYGQDKSYGQIIMTEGWTIKTEQTKDYT